MDEWEAPEFTLDGEPKMSVGPSVRRLRSSLETWDCVLREVLTAEALV